MLDLIYKLVALQIYTKDCHYNFKGTYFLTLHKWMDEIYAPLADWIDEIKESVILCDGQPVPAGVAINAEAAKYVPAVQPDNEILLEQLNTVIALNIKALNNLNSGDIKAGTGDLLGRICSHLQKHQGLLNLALNEIKAQDD